ncbi:Fic-domain-containing protein [Hypoxylon sp. FL0890]|nr:Fic-domain-containing protein [Hypoxylon sp. FL0890]
MMEGTVHEPYRLAIRISECNGHPNLWTRVQQDMIELIYTSNYIEYAGSDFDVTEKLCRQLFRGEEVTAQVEPESPDYAQARAALIALGRPSSTEDVICSRQEIINHTNALSYAINHVTCNNEPITEEFLKELHKKLCSGAVLGEDAGSPGEYRSWEIAARHGKDMKKKSVFIRASAVASYMANLVDDLRKDMLKAEAKSIDPFDMANRYCHRFVCIHPFGDGNGRMCRILLNLLFLEYTGRMSVFGGTESERQEYLDITRRGNQKFHEEDMEVPEENKKGHHELARFTVRKSRGTLQGLL